MPQKTFHYENADITVVWKPELCKHSGICARGLPLVFDPRRRPWVDLSQSTTGQVVEQVNRCPSGALSFFVNSQDTSSPPETTF